MKLANYQNAHLMAYAQQQLLPKSTSGNIVANELELSQQPLYRLYGFMRKYLSIE
jgi:hypothetical protein